MGLAAAIGVSAAAGLAGSLIQSSAASKASDQQAQSAQNALNTQQSMFNTAKGEVQPFVDFGQSQIGNLSALLNPGTAQSTLQNLPGFQFASQWGTKTAQNALSAEGLGGSTGPLAKAISDYNNGLASTQYQNQVGLTQNAVNSGSNAASSLSGNTIAAGNAMAGTQQNIGNAQAAGTLGSANAISGGLSSVSNAFLMNSLLNQGNSSVYGGNAGLTALQG